MKQTAVEFLQELNENVNLTEDDFRKAIEMEIRQTQDSCTEAYDLRKNIEISDEEIENKAEEVYGKVPIVSDLKGLLMSSAKGAWVDACKWYREQLKSK